MLVYQRVVSGRVAHMNRPKYTRKDGEDTKLKLMDVTYWCFVPHRMTSLAIG